MIKSHPQMSSQKYINTKMDRQNQHSHSKLLSIILAMTLMLSACASVPLQLENIARIASTPFPVDDRPTPTLPPNTLSTAALVKDRSKLRVGIRFDAPPLSSVTSDGKLEGLDVDLAREFARRWLGSPDNVDFVQVTSASAPSKVERREVDLAMGGLVHTKAAEVHANFSLSYLQDGDALLVRTGTVADFNSLAKHNITYIDNASTVALGNAEITSNITVSLQSAPSYDAALQQLRDSQTDAVVGRWRRFRAVAGRDPALTILTVFQNEPVAIMLPPNDSDWMDLINVTLSALIADGSYASLYQKWFGQAPDPVYPLPDAIDLQLAALPDVITPHNTLSRIRSSNSVHVGFIAQSDPLATLDANGQAVGFEIDLCRELARRWFQDPEAANFTAVPASDIPGLLRNNSIDLAVGAIPETQSNERAMDFSIATYQSGVGIAVLKSSQATDLSSLGGKSIGVIQGKPDQALLESVKKMRGINLNSVPFPDLATALDSLRNGQIDAVIDQQVTLLALARSAKDISLLQERLSRVPVGITMPTNDSEFRAFVNLTLQDMFADGTYARIYQSWFKTAPESVEIWPGEATLNTALIAPTATSLPTLTPVFGAIDTPTPMPPTAVPSLPTPTP
jgi:ABC-type amino acid transport substrate-binding protein